MRNVSAISQENSSVQLLYRLYQARGKVTFCTYVVRHSAWSTTKIRFERLSCVQEGGYSPATIKKSIGRG